ncbi:hypothetical protein RchiOBHm_Chr7g0180871 [Rosa chinensis]|uniref:Uncharacterized protein n=1 Tax=Rosa chinensis TaxID=74649 RepID=A0A2P6P2I3_ROSCH|nr:hypothetical protein RchiOBHm_Chr7g0180871 [Rosa chinensis]
MSKNSSSAVEALASILYTAWAIWSYMNNLIFKHLQASPTSCVFQASQKLGSFKPLKNF